MLNELKDFTAIIPVRIDSQDRLDNLFAVLQYMKSRLYIDNIIVVEQDTAPRLVNILPLGVRYIFVQSEACGAFTKVRLNNIGLHEVTTSTCAIWDADVIVPLQHITEGFTALKNNDCEVFVPLSDFYFINRKFLPQVKDGTIDFEKVIADKSNYSHHFTNSFGGIQMFRTEYIRHIRGFNEKFIGWGGEDAELPVRVTKLGGRVIRRIGPLLHLWHDRTPTSVPRKENIIDNQFEHNRPYFMSEEELREYFGITKLPGKYSTVGKPTQYNAREELEMQKCIETYKDYKSPY